MLKYLIMGLLLCATCLFAQKVRLGDVNMRNVIVVTNEQDTVAMEAISQLATLGRTDKLWSGETSYMDGDGVMWEIWPSVVYTSVTPGVFTGVAFNLTAVADNQYYYYAENNALLKWMAGYWSLVSENGQLMASGKGGVTDSVVNLSGGSNSTFERYESGLTTNIVDRVVTTNDNIIIVGQTKDSMGLTTNLQAKTGETEINISFAGWKEILSVIDEIPPVEFPQNAVTGWLIFDKGSNLWVNVDVTNLNFEVWEVTQ